MAKELTRELIRAGALPADDMQNSIKDIHACLMELNAKEGTRASRAGPGMETQADGVDWKKSMSRHAITCLECGGAFKQLSDRHFRQHDLNSRSYREKYEIPKSQSLAAKETTARRKKIVWQIRPWEKTTTYLQRQGQQPGAAVKRTKRRSTASRSPRRKQGRSQDAARNG